MVMRAFLAVLACLALGPAVARDDAPKQLELRLDHAQLLKLPEATATIVLGNPKIADITLQRNGFYVLTGKVFGSTNLIAQGGGGEVLATYVLRVLPNTDASQLTVQRGMNQEILHCLPRCVPAEMTAPGSTSQTTAATR